MRTGFPSKRGGLPREEAEPFLREALEARRNVLGDAHPDTLVSINNLGAVVKDLGRFTEAEPMFRDFKH